MISQLSSTPKSKKRLISFFFFSTSYRPQKLIPSFFLLFPEIGDVIRTTQETIKKLYIQLYKNRHELITSDMKLMKPIDSLPVM